MAIYIGDKKIGSLSLGGVGIREAYVGSTCVYRTEVVRTYEAPEVSLSYGVLHFTEGATGKPTFYFTQDWTDNYGNSGTLTEETTPYTAEFTAHTAGGEDAGFHFGDDGEIISDQKNTSGAALNVGIARVVVTANGMTGTAQTDVYQMSKPTDIVDPVADIDETLFQEVSGSNTKKVYFNLSYTPHSARSITPKYFTDTAGNKYDVVVEDVAHQNTSSSGTTTTNYWAELPYNGSAASYRFVLTSEFTFSEEGWRDSDCYDFVQSTNYLIINSSGDFYVRF